MGVAPGRGHDAAGPAAEVAATPHHYAQIDALYRWAPRNTAMRLEQELVSSCGVVHASCSVVHGFTMFGTPLQLPGSGSLRLLPLVSQLEHARTSELFFQETSPGGIPFVIPVLRMIGDAAGRAISNVSCTHYVGCIAEAVERGRSAVIEAAGAALLDFEAAERDLFDTEPEIDAALFHVGGDAVWAAGAPSPAATPPRRPAGSLRVLHGIAAAAERPELLECLYDIARQSFGAHDDYPIYRIAYPWLASHLESLRPGGRMLHVIDLIPGSDFIWNRASGRELAPPPRHGTVQQLMEHLRRCGFRPGYCRIVQAMEGVRTYVLLLDCLLA